MHNLEQTFLNIITRGKKDNTYKFALARFLLEFSKNTKNIEDTKIDYEKIAEHFLQYYWYQECKYKLKQDFKKETQPIVITIIQKHCGINYIPQTFENYFKDKKDLKNLIINEIKKECFKDVIARFQSKNSIFYIHNHELNKSGKKYIFPIVENQNIILKKETISFFKENYEFLFKALILEWAKFLEKTNFTPKLISKIETLNKPNRTSLKRFQKILLEIDNKCFYCGVELMNNKFHIDHFIPWSYIYEDEIWNLVLSCTSCNLKKSDYLPPKECNQKLLERNGKLLKINNSKLKKEKIFILENLLIEYYENCYNQGFLIIPDEKNLQCNI